MTRIRWTAAGDGVGHVQIDRALRTPCDLRPIDPKFAWPITSRCSVCTEAVAAITEGRAATTRPR